MPPMEYGYSSPWRSKATTFSRALTMVVMLKALWLVPHNLDRRFCKLRGWSTWHPALWKHHAMIPKHKKLVYSAHVYLADVWGYILKIMYNLSFPLNWNFFFCNDGKLMGPKRLRCGSITDNRLMQRTSHCVLILIISHIEEISRQNT